MDAKKILDLPRSTSTVVHRSLLDEQNYHAKGNKEKKKAKRKKAG